MRVEVAVLVRVLLAGVLGMLVVGLLGGTQVGHLGGVDHACVAVRGGLSYGVVDRRLEVGEVDHDVGLGDVDGLLERDLEVVRLLAGGGERLDPGGVAGDPLGDERQRVERRDHGGSVVVGGTRRAAPGEPGECGERGEGREGRQPEPSHENDSQLD